MIDAKRFALVKHLYHEVCDLPAAERDAALAIATNDAEVIAEVLLLCASSPRTQQYAQPVLEAMHALGASPVRSGDVLGSWTLKEEIGAGGMGCVYRARRSDGHFEQAAAVKVLSGIASPRALDYLARERQILATLVHPNIARLLDGGSTQQGHPYLVMEFVEGLPIDRYCMEQKLSTAQVLRLFIEVCTAVGFAHQNLVVHCDLKPSNILVGRDGRPILLDFGISRMLGEADAPGLVDAAGAPDAGVTSAGYTRLYASPEQIGQRRVGTASDIYSLGVMLAELLGVSLTEHHELSLERLSGDLQAIIRRATKIVPTERYPSAGALAADLRCTLEHRPVQARHGGYAYLAGRWLRRNWPWAVIGLLFAATVATFTLRMRVERNNALQSELTANAVKDYMVSVFQGADPEISGRRDMPVSEMLDAGRTGLVDKLADQPRVRAELVAILAGVYLNIGKREQAIAMYDEAIALERKNPRPKVLAGLLYRLAYTIYDFEDFARAEPIAREALALQRSLAADSVETMDSQRLLGTILLYQDRRDESKGELDAAMALALRIAGPDSVEAARVHLDLARFYIYADSVTIDASENAARAREIFRRVHGAGHYQYLNAIELLAAAYGYTNRFTEGLPLARELSEKRIQLYGETSNQAGFALYVEGDMLGRAGMRLDAVRILASCVDIQARLDGGQTLAASTPLSRLAQVLEEAGDSDAALARFEELISVRSRLLGPGVNDYDLSNARLYQARILRMRGEFAAAEPLAYAGLEGMRALGMVRQTARAQVELAALRREQGRLDEALATLDAIDLNVYQNSDWRVSNVQAERGRVAAARGDQAQALQHFLDAEANISRGLGEAHPDTWLLRLDRAELLAAMGQSAESRELAAKISSRAAASIAPDGLWARRIAALLRD